MQVRKRALELLRTGVGDAQATFRPEQWEAISILLKRKRLLLVEATGWGKSYVYFIVSKILHEQTGGITVLVSPLLSLMRNQLTAANRMGISAVSINSSNYDNWQEIFNRLKEKRIELLLVSPERIANTEFLNFFMKYVIRDLCFLIIDEAHCISDWGHDFRPDYQRLKRVINFLPSDIPILATTATANDRVVNDIRTQLQRKFSVLRGRLMRRSIALQNIIIPDPYRRMAWLSQAVKQLPGSGIVYVLTVRYCDIICEWLKKNGINAEAYHSRIGERDNRSRKDLEDRFINNEIKVFVATVALGMGFDKPDINFVIHFHRPGSVVHYYQQVGRAGRALEHAWGFLLQGNEDLEINNYFIEKAYPPHQFILEVLNVLERSEGGLNKKELKIRANLTDRQVDQVLKILGVISPSPISYEKGKFFRNGNRYKYPAQRVEDLKQLRMKEQEKMTTYMNHKGCLMRFLAEELDDPYLDRDCGKCNNCINADLLDVVIPTEKVIEAELFVRNKPMIIHPRKVFPINSRLKINNDIPYSLQRNGLMLSEGRILCRYHDPVLGKLVSEGKYEHGRFDDILVLESIKLIRERWFPGQELPFKWVTCIPSAKHKELVPDFASRLAEKLGIDFLGVIISSGAKKHDQKTMNNNLLKLINLDGEYIIDKKLLRKESVLLVDDMIESGWTLNLAGILLKRSGLRGDVYPFALASSREM